jgi:hypothetical protein
LTLNAEENSKQGITGSAGEPGRGNQAVLSKVNASTSRDDDKSETALLSGTKGHRAFPAKENLSNLLTQTSQERIQRAVSHQRKRGRFQYIKKKLSGLVAMVVHTCNPSYSGDWEAQVFKGDPGLKVSSPHLNKKSWA